MQSNNSPKLKALRQKLRTHGTAAEAILWTALKARQLDGWRWRRQFSIGNYILDFYCPKAKLGIELDGNNHFSTIGIIADEIKIESLSEFNIRVLHFENKMIREMPELVIETIKQELAKISY